MNSIALEEFSNNLDNIDLTSNNNSISSGYEKQSIQFKDPIGKHMCNIYIYHYYYLNFINSYNNIQIIYNLYIR